jgi:hypothetical protein
MDIPLEVKVKDPAEKSLTEKPVGLAHVHMHGVAWQLL